MIFNNVFKTCIVLWCLSLSFTNQAQNHEIELLGLQTILNNTNDANDYQFFDGEIHLKTEEVLKGDISVNRINEHQKYAAIIRIENECFYIANTKIKEVYLYERIDKRDTKTKFVTINGHHKLFREVYKKDTETIVYDLMDKPFDGKILNDVHIMENGNLLSIFNFWTSGPKKDLINYLNKRDNKNYKRRDFKSLEQLFATL
ncbi:hypothetical protein [Psychroserpens sp. SPM9]|uniref:hypothetical protein n=1 Tax=Psychroserpens sp. SPM9 TaxID=2975598 RepID=UPI0021A825A5|nr:hypothetical protein [Psychroserpens sp. SPM9]MDG5491753.1 hypothetical protein [Psychroserpens sp. SPM9]